MTKHKSVIVPFFIPHHGCPNKCVFCNQLKITGSDCHIPTSTEILAKISMYRSASNSQVQVAFYGGSFTALPAAMQVQLLSPLQSLVASGAISSIRVSTRPDAIDIEWVTFLRSLGVTTVELGVQSMADDVLAISGRGHDAAAVINACKVLRKAHISVGMQLLPGLPGDSPSKAIASLARVLKLKPDFIRIYPALVMSGTRLEQMYGAGDYVPMSLQDAVTLSKIMLHMALSSGINVIRIGLQSTEELERPGTVLSGPFHPAFRQLVESEWCFDLLANLCQGGTPGMTVTVACSPERISDVVGQRRSNIIRIKAEFGIEIARVVNKSSLTRYELEIEGNGYRKTGNLLKDINYQDMISAF